jgi:DNA transformation protein
MAGDGSKKPATRIPLESALNLGPASSAWLAEVGIYTLADLKKVGAVVAFQMVKKNRKKASLNLLYALHGALTGVRWDQLAQAEKVRLRSDVE